jgi:hypothetical protein
VTATVVAVSVPDESVPSAPTCPPTLMSANDGEASVASTNFVVVATSTVTMPRRQLPRRVKAPALAATAQLPELETPLTEMTRPRSIPVLGGTTATEVADRAPED